MTLWKTKNGQQEGFVPGVGQIVAGKIDIPDNVEVESSNLVKVEPEQTAPVAPPASPPAPKQAPVDPPKAEQSTNTTKAEDN